MDFSGEKSEKYVETFSEDPVNYGKSIKDMVKDSNRFLVNLPVYGIARRISRALEDESFSIFYKYERTLAHKLHPMMYRSGLNIFTNSRIDKLFMNKYTAAYAHNVPEKIESIQDDNIDLKINKMNQLKHVITKMVNKDGHFMVVKFCDYILNKKNRDLSTMLKAAEFKIINAKKNLSGNWNENLENLKQKLNEYKDQFDEDNAGVFIERIRWDDQLQEYADALEGSEDSKDEISEKIINYAEKIKEKYLNNTAENDIERIDKLVDAIDESNKKQHGKEHGELITKDILTLWTEDESIAEEVKNALAGILNERFGTPVKEAEVNDSNPENNDTDEVVMEEDVDIDLEIVIQRPVSVKMKIMNLK